jgi:hypothetical protein
MAGKITKKGGFIDLGDKPMEMAMPSNKSVKYYPTIHMRKAGIKKGVGKTGTALVKFKVKSVELRDGKSPETCLEITGIQEQD